MKNAANNRLDLHVLREDVTFELRFGGESESGTMRAKFASDWFGFDRSWQWCIEFRCNCISDVFLSDFVVFFAEMSSAEMAAVRVRLVATECASESSVNVEQDNAASNGLEHQLQNRISSNGEVDESTFVNLLDVSQ